MRKKLAAATLAISMIVAITACDDTPDDDVTSTTEAPGTTAGG